MKNEQNQAAAAPAATTPELPQLRGVYPFSPPPCAAPSLAESPDIRSWPDDDLITRGIWITHRLDKLDSRLSSLQFNRDRRAAANAASRTTDAEEIAAGIAILRIYDAEIAKYTALRLEFLRESQILTKEDRRRNDMRSGAGGIAIREAR